MRIETLCRYLGLTKGSFYHHFGNLDGFKQALLEAWHQQETVRIIARLEPTASAQQRRDTLNNLVQQVDNQLERALRGWALYDPLVAGWIERVDHERIDFLTHLAKGQTAAGCSPELVARLAYANFIGSRQLDHMLSAEDALNMEQLLQSLLLRADR